MTKAMQYALDKFKAAGDSGILDKYGRLLVNGEPIKFVSPATWLRLILAGEMRASGGRFYADRPQR